MIISAENFNGEDVRISLQAESEAEKHQLASMRKQLDRIGAVWNEWDNLYGGPGITIVAMIKNEQKT